MGYRHLIDELVGKGLAHPPNWMVGGIQYLTYMGSVAYGVSSDNSDLDIYGFCIPPKRILFPHTAGVIQGFGNQGEKFDQWQQHHMLEVGAQQTYDAQVYNIVKYFQLCMDNNPNMIDSLFTPERCVCYISEIGQKVRDNRKIFLHKGLWPKFKGYAYSQVHKMQIKTPEPGSKRIEYIEKYGYDVKFAYHVVRLLDECEQALTTGDIDLERDRERLKSIRRGEWKENEILEFFKAKEKDLERALANSKLPEEPNEPAIKELLTECLEIHFSNLTGCLDIPDQAKEALLAIQQIIDKNKNLINS